MSKEANMNILLFTDMGDLKLLKRGKVRDIYDLGEFLLLVATDRISAFDVVLHEGIPDKGYVLTQLSRYWFRETGGVVKNHVVSFDVADFPAECRKYADQLEGRSVLVKKCKPFPVECIVRGYLAGSGWKEYQAGGTVCKQKLPAGLVQSSRIEPPIFTPSTKAEEGHDINISFAETAEIIGEEKASLLRDLSLKIYMKARDEAIRKGIIIADTKFEFGESDGEIILIDELLTPDSSRFWYMKDYQEGRPQESFDKQVVRDYLLTLDWDKKPPAPRLPPEIVKKASDRYKEILERIRG